MLEIPKEYMIAVGAIVKASIKIMTVYNEAFDVEIKGDGSPLTIADLESSKIIEEALRETKIPITGEETKKGDYEIRKTWNKSWCVDPLDGTKEFVNRNGEFAVNIALIEKQTPTFGLIASPVSQQILFGDKDLGVFTFSFDDADKPSNWNKVKAKDIPNRPIGIVYSRSHSSGPMDEFIEELKVKYGEPAFVKKGSSLKFFDLALGRADVYPRFAPTMEWDIASGQAILNALGGEVIHAETKKPLIYNKENLKNPSFIASTKAILNNTDA